MDIESAKALLIENAVGQNDYENLSTWEELVAASDFERQCATDRIRQLSRIESAANEQSSEIPEPAWTPPEWCRGLSKRTADGLVRRAQYENVDQVVRDRNEKPDSHFTTISNFGSKCLAELDEWLKMRGLI